MRTRGFQPSGCFRELAPIIGGVFGEAADDPDALDPHFHSYFGTMPIRACSSSPRPAGGPDPDARMAELARRGRSRALGAATPGPRLGRAPDRRDPRAENCDRSCRASRVAPPPGRRGPSPGRRDRAPCPGHVLMAPWGGRRPSCRSTVPTSTSWRTGGDHPPLVLLHGLTDDGPCWTRTALGLEARTTS